MLARVSTLFYTLPKAGQRGLMNGVEGLISKKKLPERGDSKTTLQPLGPGRGYRKTKRTAARGTNGNSRRFRT